jgi:hypothetical protein
MTLLNFLNCSQAFALQLNKSTESLSQGSGMVLDTNHCVEMASLLGAASTGLLSINQPWLTVGDFRQPLVGTSSFQVPELRSSPY